MHTAAEPGPRQLCPLSKCVREHDETLDRDFLGAGGRLNPGGTEQVQWIE
jgi:hypothetical protein